MLKTHKFARKPFFVDAVRVSENNIEEVAAWCDGKIESSDEGRFVSVEVHRPMNERQTQAFVGDWVLFAGSGYKVYTPKAFDKSFEKVKTLTKAQADEAGIKVPHEPKQKKGPVKFPGKLRPTPAPPANPVLSKEIAGKLVEDQGRTETEVPKAPPAPEPDEADKLIAEVMGQPLPTDKS